MIRKSLVIFLFIAIALAACGPTGTPPALATDASSQITQPPTQDQEQPEQTPTEAQSGQASLPALAPEPEEITFQASDGQELSGYYYPAAVNPAPVVVFMHWVAGNMADWYEIAPWLQNRGLKNPFPNPGDESWWDPTWFPPVPQGTSYGVFIFSFRSCEPYDTGCTTGTPPEWLLDAQAAVDTASQLDGVDPTKVVTIGSSIGADGAIDGCAYLAEQQPGSCQGALSLSPGDYLTVVYREAVKSLGEAQPPVAAWCLADEFEVEFCNAASDVGNTKFNPVEIPNGGHGNFQLRPDLEPLPMQLILDFLSQMVGTG
jgi:pimeloyl-ACP methyl ester carboxylesterase